MECAKNLGKEEIVLNPLKCQKCEKTFDWKKRLKKHFKEVHPVKVECAVCNESFIRNCDLEVHIEVYHKDPKVGD